MIGFIISVLVRSLSGKSRRFPSDDLPNIALIPGSLRLASGPIIFMIDYPLVRKGVSTLSPTYADIHLVKTTFFLSFLILDIFPSVHIF